MRKRARFERRVRQNGVRLAAAAQGAAGGGVAQREKGGRLGALFAYPRQICPLALPSPPRGPAARKGVVSLSSKRKLYAFAKKSKKLIFSVLSPKNELFITDST